MRNGEGYKDPTASQAFYNSANYKPKPKKKPVVKQEKRPIIFDSTPAWVSDELKRSKR